jgi:hypothetical protein
VITIDEQKIDALGPSSSSHLAELAYENRSYVWISAHLSKRNPSFEADAEPPDQYL